MSTIGIVVLIVIALFALFQGTIYLQAKKARGKPVADLGADALDLLEGRGDALIYFYSPNCIPCRAMTPAVDELSNEFDGVIKVDVSQTPEPAIAFQVRATPTLVLIRNGSVADILLGAKNKSQMLQIFT